MPSHASHEKTLSDFIRDNLERDGLSPDAHALGEALRGNLSQDAVCRIDAMPNGRDKAVAVLQTVQDPELSVNIWDLGLIYRLDVAENSIDVDMTLTAPACPVADMMPAEAKRRLERFFGEGVRVCVTLVWQPSWDKTRMTDEAKLMLDMW
ncbi:MAG: iron-sulfur cluster assembly protein [Rickettsiales bacterium]